MNRPLPECMPCVLRFKDPEEQLNYMLYVKAMIELGFMLDTDNNVYTKLVDDKTMAYLTTIYSKDEVYDYVKGCLDMGFSVTSGPRAPRLDELREYQSRVMNNERVTIKDILDDKGIGIYLENYLDIIKERSMENVQIPYEESSVKMGR